MAITRTKPMENNEETVEQTTEEQTTETEETQEETQETEETKEEVDYKAEALKWKAIAERNKKKPQKSKETTSSVNSLEERLFFIENKEYADRKDLIKSLKKDGQSLEDVVKSPAFKEVDEKLKKLDELESNKSVIHNNARVANPDSNQAKDLEKASKTGDFTDYLAKYKGVKM